MERAEDAWGAWGTIYYDDSGRVLGSMQYGPGELYPKAAELPAGPPSADAMLVTCAYLVDASTPWVMQSLFLAAIGEARDQGAKALEAFADRLLRRLRLRVIECHCYSPSPGEPRSVGNPPLPGSDIAPSSVATSPVGGCRVNMAASASLVAWSVVVASRSACSSNSFATPGTRPSPPAKLSLS